MAAVLRTPADLRVVMFSNLYPPVVSGSSTHCSALARELTRRGVRVAVVTARLTPDAPEHERPDGVDVYRLPCWRLPRLPIALNFPWLNATFSPANLRRIGRILDRHRPHVLHLHNHMFDLGFSAALARHRRGLPLVCTVHTMIRHASPLCNLVLLPADRLFLRHAVVRHVDTLLCPDANMHRYVAEAFRRPESPLLPYGVRLPERPPPAEVERLRRRHGLEGRRVLLSLGHVHDIRNRKDLVEAMPAVLRAVPDAVLLVVGAVATQLPVRLARDLGVAGAVRFAGPAPHEQVPALLALADLEAHWLNQDRPENTSLGIASLEAMGAGKAVLAAANPDTYGPGVLRPGENFVLVTPGRPAELAATVVGLLGDHALRDRIGARARQTVREHFSWDVICRRTVEVYQALLGRDGPALRRAA
jgi:glycosyltransferase involved in cell wall biosynthesis